MSHKLDSDNSYIRTRGLTLLAYNAKWDKDFKQFPLSFIDFFTRQDYPQHL